MPVCPEFDLCGIEVVRGIHWRRTECPMRLPTYWVLPIYRGWVRCFRQENGTVILENMNVSVSVVWQLAPLVIWGRIRRRQYGQVIGRPIVDPIEIIWGLVRRYPSAREDCQAWSASDDRHSVGSIVACLVSDKFCESLPWSLVGRSIRLISRKQSK